MTTVLGIDPGQSGGWGLIGPDGASCGPWPETERDSWFLFASVSKETFALIERVGSMPHQGLSSTFKFGRHYGFLRGLLIASGIPFEEVSPTVWQREFGLVFPKAMGLTATEKKNRHKARAQQLWPGLNITHATADALLIAEWGARRRDRP